MSTDDSIAPSKLDPVIDNLLETMIEKECDSDEYGKMSTYLVNLYKAKDIEVTLQLKESEVNNRSDEAADAHRLKREELELKIMEQQQAASIRFNESNLSKELKQAELDLKERETAALIHLKEAETALKAKEFDTPNRVSLDTWAIIAANLAGIAIIIGYERVNVITTKALGFVTRMR